MNKVGIYYAMFSRGSKICDFLVVFMYTIISGANLVSIAIVSIPLKLLSERVSLPLVGRTLRK